MHNQELYNELVELAYKILHCECEYEGDVLDCEHCAFQNKAGVCIATSLYDFTEMMGMKIDE